MRDLSSLENIIHDAFKEAEKNDKLSEFFRLSLNVIKLYILCHIEFYFSFIEYGKLKTDKNIYDLALRYCQEGGHSIIYSLFLNSLIKMQTKPDFYMNKMNEIYTKGKINKLIVCFDEVIVTKSSLIGYFMHSYLKHFDSFHIKLQKEEIETKKVPNNNINANNKPTNLLYAFTIAAEELVNNGIASVFISTHFSAFNALLNEKRPFSRSVMNFTRFFDLPIITTDDIINYFETKFGITLERWKIEYFSGRPLFFSYLLTEFLNIKSKDENIEYDIESIISEAKHQIKETVKRYISSMEGKYERTLFSLNMHGGILDFESKDIENEVNNGIARVINVSSKSIKAKIYEQPILEELNSIINTEMKPNEDVIFKYIGSNLNDNSKEGLLSEFVTARILIREGINILFKWFNDTPGFNQLSFFGKDNPNIDFSPKLCGTKDEIELNFSKSLEFSDFFDKNILFRPSNLVGPDLMTSIVLEYQVVPICIQVKNWNRPLGPSDIKKCLESLHPKFFFEEGNSSRNDFINWWKRNPNFFDKYIRVIVSFSGFSDQALNLVCKFKCFLNNYLINITDFTH